MHVQECDVKFSSDLTECVTSYLKLLAPDVMALLRMKIFGGNLQEGMLGTNA